MQPMQPSMLESMIPFLGLFAIVYFFFLRPQARRLKDHEAFLKSVKRGDQVITSSGILGTVDGLTEQFVTLEIANGVKIRMLKKQIASSAAAATAPVSADGKKLAEAKK